MGGTDQPGPTLDDLSSRLTSDAVTLYKFAVGYPGWNRDGAATTLGLAPAALDDAIQVLLDLHLVRRSRDDDREFDTLSPDTAVVELLTEDEEQIRRRQATHGRIRHDLLALLPTYFSARQSRRKEEAIDVVEDVEMVRHLLADHSRRCRKEIMIAHPGSGMSPDGIARSIALDLVMLERGVALRSVLQHVTRRHRPTQHYVAAVVPAGAMVRTAPIVPRRLIVFDSETAFLPPSDGDPTGGAVLVREPSVVNHLVASFELLWQTARPFPTDEEEVADGDVPAAEVRQAILNEMAGGAKDELIARRLGISLRTCRRYIADLTKDLGAQSRFQAGVLAAQRGLLG